MKGEKKGQRHKRGGGGQKDMKKEGEPEKGEGRGG